MILRKIFIAAIIAGIWGWQPARSIFAAVEHKEEWWPTRDVKVTAPLSVPEEQRTSYEQRDAAPAVEKLAHVLFGLLNPDYQSPVPAQRALYRAAFTCYDNKQYAQALAKYQEFFFARLRQPPAGFQVPGLHPAKRTFIEYFNTADELMQGIFRYEVFDQPLPEDIALGGTDLIINYYRAGRHNQHMVNLIIQNGPPGAMNWTYMPQGFWGGTWHMPSDHSYVAVANNGDMVFTPLLAAYLEKHDPRYLQRWCGYIDDYLLNYRRALANANLRVQVGPAGAGGPSILHLIYVIQNSPEADRDLPATTFVRLLTNTWISDFSAIIRATRKSAANRVMHMYGALLLDNYVKFPELRLAEGLLRERRRCLESYAHLYMNPDGTGIDYAPNYNKNYLLLPPNDVNRLETMSTPPAWLTPEWKQELLDNQLKMARYLIRYFAPNGCLPGYKDATHDLREQTIGKNSYLKKCVPQALEEPESKRVIAALLRQAAEEQPRFQSESYPYGGYYFMRENWQPDGLFLYFNNFRPGENANNQSNQNVAVQAYGQSMLNFFRWESPLLVDDCRQISSATFYQLHPYYLSRQPVVSSYGKWVSHSAWREPQQNRWHTSERYDFAEGDLRIPHTGLFPERTSVYLDDVTHHRQIFFLRQAKAWIVAERIRAHTPHVYDLRWSFEPAQRQPEGWQPLLSKKKETKPKKDGAEPLSRPTGYAKTEIVADPQSATIRTISPTLPNLAIFHTASVPLKLTPGQVEQNTDAWYGNAYTAGPRFLLEQEGILASLLYPSRNGRGGEGVQFSALPLPDGAAFDAELPGGQKVSYRSSLSVRELTAAGITARAKALVVCPAAAGGFSGIVLDGTEFSVSGKRSELPAANCEFTITANDEVAFTPIYTPLKQVTIHPEADLFIGQQTITLTHEAPGVDIRYTVNGDEPSQESPLYQQPFSINETAWVRARAFRRGVPKVTPAMGCTLASVEQKALFRKAGALWPALPAGGARQAGLRFSYYEDDWSLSLIKLPALSPLVTGRVPRLFDTTPRNPSIKSYAFRYEGYVEIPVSGVYNFHAPQELFDLPVDTGYDLQMVLDGQEWYPATRTHNFGNWSVPLEKGLHRLSVTYLDYRPGDQMINLGEATKWAVPPSIEVSGPGMDKTALPEAWLFTQE